MHKNLPKNITQIKGKIAQEELRRAHYIIVILALSFAFVVTIEIFQPMQFNTTLGEAVIALLILVAAISFAIAIRLGKAIKK